MLPLKQHSKRRDDVEDKLNKPYCRGCRWSISKGGKGGYDLSPPGRAGFRISGSRVLPLAEGVMVSSIISSRPRSKLYSKAGFGPATPKSSISTRYYHHYSGGVPSEPQRFKSLTPPLRARFAGPFY
jgi:hypothetical protein